MIFHTSGNLSMIFYPVLFLTLLSTSVHAVPPSDGRLWSSQPQQTEITRLIVKPSGGVIAAASGMDKQASRAAFAKQAALDATGMEMEVLRHLATGAVLLELSTSISPQQAEEYARWIAQRTGVEYAEPDRRMWPMLTPNDTFYGAYQGHLQAPADGGPGAANLPDAWDITTGSGDIVVAVLDTGALDHEDLQNRFVGGSVAASGRDFITYDANYPFLPIDGDGRDSDPTDPGDWTDGTYCTAGNSSWHGLHVAGTIGAETNNGLDVAGVDWQAKLLTARVLGRCGGFTSDIADAMIWSAGTTVDSVANPNPARVLNLSLGGGGACSTTEQDAIDAAVAQGATVVVAAGNSNDDVLNYSPANCNNVVTVSALDSSDGARASFSNYGEEVEIAAPGVRIASLANRGATTATDDAAAFKSGTSMAAPHVSGVVALMLAANQAAGGDLMTDARKAETSSRITAKLQASARAFATGTGDDCATNTCGAGMLDGHQAVVAVSTAPNVNASNDQWALNGASVTLSATAADDAYNTATTWQWSQTTGSAVTLNNAATATADFTAPAINETLTFSVTATDDTGLANTDQIDVHVSTTVDTTPNAFSFTDQTDVSLNTTITSGTITISGINTAAAISVTGGQYSINGGAYTSSAGTINGNDTVTVQHTSSANFSTAVDTVLTIDSVSDTFTSTTLAADTTPDAFTFVDQTDVALRTLVVSAPITVSGINTAAAISVTSGQYSVNGGSHTSTAGTVNNGDTVSVQHTSSSNFSTATDTVLSIGGVSDTFTSTTLAADTTPDTFRFSARLNVPTNGLIESDPITVQGTNTTTPLSIANGLYSINDSAYVSTAGTVNNGDVVRVRHDSSANFSTQTDTVLSIGGLSATFSSTTVHEADSDGDGIVDSEDDSPNDNTQASPKTPGGDKLQIRIDGGGRIRHMAALSADDASLSDTGKPSSSSFDFPYGVVQYELADVTQGGTATVTITYPQTLDSGSEVYKITDAGYASFANVSISGNQVTLTLVDGGAGDDDGMANGIIVDPVTVAVPISNASSGGGGGGAIGLWSLLCLYLVAGMIRVRRRIG